MPSSKRTNSKDVTKDVTLYGKTSAAAYLGLSEVHLERLVKHGRIRYWQEIPPERLPDGRLRRGSGLVFQEHWLDEYKTAPGPGPGWPKGRPRKPKPPE